MPLRVLHISAGNLYGGVETVLVTLARFRDLCQEIEPSFGVCFEGRVSGELADLGVPVHMLGNVRTRRVYSVFRARQRLRKLLREEPVDVVICHMSWAHAIFGPEVRRAGIPLVFWAHGAGSGSSWIERWARLTKPMAAIANSAYTAACVPGLFGNVPVHVVYCPVAGPEEQAVKGDAIRRELKIPDDRVIILQVSRMEAWKGHELHLRALAQLRDNPSWVCLIAGGAQRPEERRYADGIERLVRELDLTGRVFLLGHRSDVRSVMAAADIFCQPNQAPEPFGIVFIEALFARLPVVTTALGGAMEIVTESCGVMAPPANPTALAECLRDLVTSPGRRLALGQAGPARARRLCDPAKQLHLLHRVLTDCVQVAISARVVPV